MYSTSIVVAVDNKLSERRLNVILVDFIGLVSRGSRSIIETVMVRGTQQIGCYTNQ